MSSMQVSRRRFLRNTAVAGGGLVVGFSLTGCSTPTLPISRETNDFVPNAFIQITPDNVVRFYCPRDEMGQGVTTGLATLVAEELDVDPASIEVRFAGVHSDYNNPDMGVQGTDGSNSMKAHYLPLRQAAADTRAALLQVAASEFDVSSDRLQTEDRHVVVGGERHPYGQFVAAAARLELPESTPLKADSEFRCIGKNLPRLDAIAKASGTAEYGIDADIPGMVHAVVIRSPVVGAKLLSVDKSQASNMPGVSHVFQIASGLAVVADKYWQAKTAASKLQPKWQEVPLSKVSSEQVHGDYVAALDGGEGTVEAERGDLTEGFEQA